MTSKTDASTILPSRQSQQETQRMYTHTHTAHVANNNKKKPFRSFRIYKICALQDEESVVCLALICTELNTFDYLLMALNSL